MSLHRVEGNAPSPLSLSVTGSDAVHCICAAGTPAGAHPPYMCYQCADSNHGRNSFWQYLCVFSVLHVGNPQKCQVKRCSCTGGRGVTCKLKGSYMNGEESLHAQRKWADKQAGRRRMRGTRATHIAQGKKGHRQRTQKVHTQCKRVYTRCRSNHGDQGLHVGWLQLTCKGKRWATNLWPSPQRRIMHSEAFFFFF